MKKIITLALSSLLFLTLLTGCGQENETPEDDGNTLHFFSYVLTDEQTAAFEEIFADFEEETGIHVEASYQGTWSEAPELLNSMKLSGTPVDIFIQGVGLIQSPLGPGAMIKDLTNIVDEEVLNRYEDGVLDSCYMGDHLWCLPMTDGGAWTIMYNKTMFDEAGIPYPDETWTWDKLVEVAKQLTKPDGSQYGFAMRNDTNQEGYYNIVYDMGGQIISDDKTTSGYDDPNTIKAMQVVEQLINDGSMPSIETMSENGPDVLLKSGKTAMSFHGSWMISSFKEEDYIKENCDCAVMPMDAESGRRVSIYNGLGWAAAANGDNTENAWKLIEYLGSEEAQVKQAELGVTMSAWDGTSEAWVNCAPEFNLQAYLDMRDDMVIRPYSRNTVTWENRASELLKEAWAGNMTMEDTCKQIAEEMNATLAEEQ